MQHNIRGGPFLLGRSNIVVNFCLNALMLSVHFLHCMQLLTYGYAMSGCAGQAERPLQASRPQRPPGHC